jgi:hypothetical protein
MANDPYMTKTEALLRDGKAMLEAARARAEKAGAEANMVRIDGHRKIKELETRYAEVSRRFEELRAAGGEGVADLKVGLEKAWDAFQSEIGWKP